MTAPSASIQALRSLGYTNGESEFLYLVAIHSGYFTHSQYLIVFANQAGLCFARIYGQTYSAKTRELPCVQVRWQGLSPLFPEGL